KDSEVFDPAKNAWSKTSVLNPTAGIMKNTVVNPPVETARSNHVAVLGTTGRIVISGGVGVDGGGNQVLKTTFVFDPATNGFQQVDDAPTRRFWHQGVLLGTSKILVCTGLDDKGQTSHSADLFDGT